MNRTFFPFALVGRNGGVRGGADGPMSKCRSSSSFSARPGVATVLHAPLPNERFWGGVCRLSRDEVSILDIAGRGVPPGEKAGETHGVARLGVVFLANARRSGAEKVVWGGEDCPSWVDALSGELGGSSGKGLISSSGIASTVNQEMAQPYLGSTHVDLKRVCDLPEGPLRHLPPSIEHIVISAPSKSDQRKVNMFIHRIPLLSYHSQNTSKSR